MRPAQERQRAKKAAEQAKKEAEDAEQRQAEEKRRAEVAAWPASLIPCTAG